MLDVEVIEDAATATVALGPSRSRLLAELAEPASAAALAARLGIRASTARSYLKDTLQKTGATRQAELAALLARI